MVEVFHVVVCRTPQRPSITLSKVPPMSMHALGYSTSHSTCFMNLVINITKHFLVCYHFRPVPCYGILGNIELFSKSSSSLHSTLNEGVEELPICRTVLCLCKQKTRTATEYIHCEDMHYDTNWQDMFATNVYTYCMVKLEHALCKFFN